MNKIVNKINANAIKLGYVRPITKAITKTINDIKIISIATNIAQILRGDH